MQQNFDRSIKKTSKIPHKWNLNANTKQKKSNMQPKINKKLKY